MPEAKTILLVEDDRSLALHWQSLLEDEGFRVIHQSTVGSAIQALEGTYVDLVITDIMLEDDQGFTSEQGGLKIVSYIALNLDPLPRIIVVSGAVGESAFVDRNFGRLDSVVALRKPIPDGKLLEAVKSSFDSTTNVSLNWSTEVLSLHQSPSTKGSTNSQDSIELLKATQFRLQQTQFSLDHAPDGVYWIDENARFVYTNLRNCELLGYSREELLTKSIVDISPAVPTVEFFQTNVASKITESGITFERELLCKDGSTVAVEVSARLLIYEGERLFCAYIRDISERKAREAEIIAARLVAEESERRFRGLANSALMMIWTTEADSSCSWVNQYWVDYCGKPLESQLGFGWAETIHPDDRDQAITAYQAAFEERQPFRLDYRLLGHDQKYRWFAVNAAPRFDLENNFAGYVGLNVDVHDDRTRERENRLLSAAIKNSKDAFLVASVEANPESPEIVFANEAFTKMTGYQIEDLEQADFKTLLNDREMDADSIELLRDQVEHWQVIQRDMLVRRKDGPAFWANVKMTPIANDANVFTHWLIVYHDIDERVLTTHALKSVSESRRAMLELLGSTDGVWDWDLTNDSVEFQPGYRKVLGYDKDDRVGMPDSFEVFAENLHPEDRERIFAAQKKALKSDGLFEEEFRLKKKDGTYIWVHDRAAAIFGSDGKAVRMTGSIYDITERKKIEAALDHERRLLEESNADLQQFASVASHDLQEPLRAVSGFLQLLEKKYADQLDEKGRAYIQKSVAGASRMSQLINDLLLFSRVSKSSEGFAKVNLNTVVAEAQQDLEQTIETSQASIESVPLPTINGARPLLIQLFRNLIGNSIKYRSDANPRIKISSTVEDQVCTIQFQDNGIGIPVEYRHQVFELFKRLHHREQHSGTGIGLAICKRVVERHGGSIDVEPNEKQGTCFLIRLPLNA